MEPVPQRRQNGSVQQHKPPPPGTSMEKELEARVAVLEAIFTYLVSESVPEETEKRNSYLNALHRKILASNPPIPGLTDHFGNALSTLLQEAARLAATRHRSSTAKPQKRQPR